MCKGGEGAIPLGVTRPSKQYACDFPKFADKGYFAAIPCEQLQFAQSFLKAPPPPIH
jgi:hypothetical protein